MHQPSRAHLHDNRRSRSRATEPRTIRRFFSASTRRRPQAALRDALVAHLTGSADALHHARGRRRRTDRSRRAHVVGAVRLRAAGEVVPPDRPLKALALGGSRDLHACAHREGLDGHGLADLELAGLVAKLDQMAHRRRVGLLQVTELGFAQMLLARGAESQLDRLIAVALDGADGGHGARAGLQYGHARDRSILAEDLGHAELLGEDRGHHFSSRGGSRSPRPGAGDRGAGANRRSSASAGGCRSGACACGSRRARANPCP